MAFLLECPHGRRTARTGVSASGKIWAGLFCSWKLCDPVWCTAGFATEFEQLQAQARLGLERAAIERSAVWSERTRKLLALAVSTTSDEEAALALAKARESHRAEREAAA